MKGYYHNEEATRETIRDGWLYTGDVARVDADGYFHFVDRIKDMIKRAGENVAAGEVEAALLQHPDVADAAVIGVPDPIRDEKIIAYVIPRSPDHAAAEELVTHCRARLAPFKVPEHVEFVGRTAPHVGGQNPKTRVAPAVPRRPLSPTGCDAEKNRAGPPRPRVKARTPVGAGLIRA